ncbi:hypothetical protein [Yeosuana marina]|uniref:hypothetical protein n=1 Tax=Yeosuana marina TaxID=1565536 RepID=UPI001420E555|nr:hypothetical protein [Yeosuana marina]
MNKRIENITNLPKKELPILNDKVVAEKYNKGWSYSNVYYLQPVKDIYLIIKNSDSTKLNNRKIREDYLKITADLSSKWSDRKILEYVNGIKNFGLIDQDYNVLRDVFADSVLGNEITTNDLIDFKDIFFNYFRFKEISSWYINPTPETHDKFESLNLKYLIDSSKPLYAMKDGKFFNKIILHLEDNDTVYVINEKSSHLMRFYEVFLKWSTTLGIMEKFNLNLVNIKTSDNREITMSYFIKPFKPFDLKKLIVDLNIKKRQISIPELVFEIAKRFCYSVSEIKDFIINQIQNSDDLTYERTSAVFILKGRNNKEKIKAATYLYPIINDSYVSHLIIRK